MGKSTNTCSQAEKIETGPQRTLTLNRKNLNLSRAMALFHNIYAQCNIAGKCWRHQVQFSQTAALQIYRTTAKNSRRRLLNIFCLHPLVVPRPPADCSLTFITIYANKKQCQSSHLTLGMSTNSNAASTARWKDVCLTHHPSSWAATLAGAEPGAGSRPTTARLPAAPGRGCAFSPQSPHPLSGPGRKERRGGGDKSACCREPHTLLLTNRSVQHHLSISFKVKIAELVYPQTIFSRFKHDI